jgi:hypothetical protein
LSRGGLPDSEWAGVDESGGRKSRTRRHYVPLDMEAIRVLPDPGQRWSVYSSQPFPERATGQFGWAPKNGLGAAVERLPAAGAEGRLFKAPESRLRAGGVMDDHAGNARMKGEARQATDKARDAFKRWP